MPWRTVRGWMPSVRAKRFRRIEVIVPRGETVLSAGDEVLILAECGEETLLRQTFGVHAEGR